MRLLILVSLMLLPLSVHAVTEKINYKLVMEVKSQRMGKYLVRYIATLKGLCMGHLQSLESDKNNNWSIYQSKILCEMDGKSTATDFAAVSIEGLIFEKNAIQMTIITFPLVSGGKYFRSCIIKVNNGKFSPMRCDKPQRVGE